MTGEIRKPAYNEEFRTFQWRRPDGLGQLNADETVTEAEVVCTDRASGTDMTAAMVDQVAPYDTTQVRYRLKGGEKGRVYRLDIRITTNNGQKLSDTLLLTVI